MEVNWKRWTAWRHSEAGSQEDVITRQPVGTDRGDQEVGGINNPPNSTTNEGNGGLQPQVRRGGLSINTVQEYLVMKARFAYKDKQQLFKPTMGETPRGLNLV